MNYGSGGRCLCPGVPDTDELRGTGASCLKPSLNPVLVYKVGKMYLCREREANMVKC